MNPPAIAAVIFSLALWPGPPAGQAPCPERDAAQVVRELLDRDAVVRMPVKGRERQSIKQDDDLFATPHGPSRVRLVRLPDTSSPYDLIIRTRHSSALVFNDAIDLTRIVPEFDFVSRGLALRKEPRLETTISIAPYSKERFILLYGLDGGALLELETLPSKRAR